MPSLTPDVLFAADPVAAARAKAERMRAGRGIPVPLAAVPDEELIRTLMSLGQPRWSAEQIRRNPEHRLAALRLWVDVGDAAKGNAAAKERVDYVRAAFERMRHAELVSDNPARVSGETFDPKVLL